MIVIGRLFAEQRLADFLRHAGSRTRIAIPVIDRASFESMRLTMYYRTGPCEGQALPATAAVVAFRGDPAIFGVSPERPYRRSPLGALVGNRLIVAIYREHPVAVEVEAALLGEIERVERWLTRIEDEIRAAGRRVA
jgi:hypothetical protein